MCPHRIGRSPIILRRVGIRARFWRYGDAALHQEPISFLISNLVITTIGEQIQLDFKPEADLPKTRNMKVMRRVVRAVYGGAPPGDLAALLNPEAVDELKQVLAARG